jgi:hypothetical protein
MMFKTALQTGYPTAILAIIASVLVVTTLPAGVLAAVLMFSGLITGIVWAVRAVRRRRSPTTVQDEGAARVFDRQGPRVAARYESLYTYLEHRAASNVVLTFEQVESLLGFQLPQMALIESDWWMTGAPHADRHSEAWIVAERSATPNLMARTVSFERWG